MKFKIAIIIVCSLISGIEVNGKDGFDKESTSNNRELALITIDKNSSQERLEKVIGEIKNPEKLMSKTLSFMYERRNIYPLYNRIHELLPNIGRPDQHAMVPYQVSTRESPIVQNPQNVLKDHSSRFGDLLKSARMIREKPESTRNNNKTMATKKKLPRSKKSVSQDAISYLSAYEQNLYLLLNKLSGCTISSDSTINPQPSTSHSSPDFS